MMMVEIPPPKEAQLNWSHAAPVDWSMFLNWLPFDWRFWLAGGCLEEALDPKMMMKDLEKPEEEK